MPDQAMPATPHPLFRALRLLLHDLLSTFVFVGLFALTHSIAVAVSLAIAAGVGEVGWAKMRGRPVVRMQWLSLFLVVVFGGATLLTGNPTFAMLKPALIYAAVGIVLLSPGWMNHYAPTMARGVDLSGVNLVFGYVWAALFGVIAAASLAVALLASTATFAAFVLVVPIAAKCILVGVQYAATRRLVRRRLIERALELPAG